MGSPQRLTSGRVVALLDGPRIAPRLKGQWRPAAFGSLPFANEAGSSRLKSGYLGFLLDQVTIGDGSGGSPTDVVFANGFEEGSAPDYMCH